MKEQKYQIGELIYVGSSPAIIYEAKYRAIELYNLQKHSFWEYVLYVNYRSGPISMIFSEAGLSYYEPRDI